MTKARTDTGKIVIRDRHCSSCAHCLVAAEDHIDDKDGPIVEAYCDLDYVDGRFGDGRLRVEALTRARYPRGFRAMGRCDDYESTGEPCEL